MKTKTYILSCLMLLGTISISAQTITLNACNGLIENQDFTFNLISADATGRNYYQTTPITGDQNCSGVGICELQIAWNNSNSRWEIVADDGNGTFTNTYVLYYNTEPSSPDPPSLDLGNWEDNSPNTLCGGRLTSTNSTFRGALQNEVTLSISTADLLSNTQIILNSNSLSIEVQGQDLKVLKLEMSNLIGQNVSSGTQKISLDGISQGMYILQIQTDKGIILKKVIVP